MRSRFFLGFGLIAMLGCGKSVPKPAPLATATPSTPTPIVAERPEAEPFRTLRTEASKRGITWDVYCSSDEDEEGYTALAFGPNDKIELYIEDGGTKWWSTANYPTQAAAAKALLAAIHRPPNAHAEHKPKETKRKKKQCLSTISGGNFGDRYANDCKECGDSR